jgi:hypothetical protein
MEMKQRYSLKWTVGNEPQQHLQRFFNPDRLTLDVMIQKVKEMVRLLPRPLMGQIVKFGVLVGLRPAELVESIRLIMIRNPSYNTMTQYSRLCFTTGLNSF